MRTKKTNSTTTTNPTGSTLAVTDLPIEALEIPGCWARIHPAKQIGKIRKSIDRVGFIMPVVIGADNKVLAGVARLQAARDAGLTTVPTVSLAHLPEKDQRAYILADNRLAEMASWDEDILKIELEEIRLLDDTYDLTDLGWEVAEVDRLLVGAPADKPEPPTPAVEAVAVSRLGDVWRLGDHILVCGDARDDAVWDRLMPDGEEGRMVFTDPPYNVRVRGHITKRDADKREFAMASGEMSEDKFNAFLDTTIGKATGRCVDGAIAFVCIDWRHVENVILLQYGLKLEMKNLIVWAKPNAGMGTFYRSRHELIVVFKKGEAAHVNTFGLGDTGRYRTNVWEYPGASGFHADRDSDLAMHVTPKPVAMVAEAILDVSHPGDIVIDPFGGSGSTLMAAEQTRRKARLIEIDPLYVDVICRRFLQAGGQVTHADTGATFAEVEARRLAANLGEAA